MPKTQKFNKGMMVKNLETKVATMTGRETVLSRVKVHEAFMGGLRVRGSEE
jgi:hypothetical protein